jgi:hypothetical protein
MCRFVHPVYVFWSKTRFSLGLQDLEMIVGKSDAASIYIPQFVCSLSLTPPHMHNTHPAVWSCASQVQELENPAGKGRFTTLRDLIVEVRDGVEQALQSVGQVPDLLFSLAQRPHPLVFRPRTTPRSTS